MPTHTIASVPGPYAVVAPVDLDRPVRVIDWPGRDSLNTLYREIGCSTIDLRTIGGPDGLGVWTDQHGVLGDEWSTNGRIAWLAVSLGEPMLLVAGAVVVTLNAVDHDEDTLGLSRELADQLAAITRAVPEHDGDGLTRLLRETVDRGPLLMTVDENFVPDGFVV